VNDGRLHLIARLLIDSPRAVNFIVHGDGCPIVGGGV